MLYRPEAFEPLTDERWNEGRVREAIRTIVAETDDALRGPRLLWRAHAWDRWQATSPMKNLYVGAAGSSGRSIVCGHADTRTPAWISRRSPRGRSTCSVGDPTSRR
jgi:hypothetical protein